jgi:hypothetical protein
VAQHPFPGSGHDGDEPLPGVPARDWAEENDRYLAWLVAEADAGRIEIPDEEPPPSVLVCIGEDPDLAGLSGAGFATREAADVMPPGPVLGALTSQATEDVASLPDDELLGVISAARRQQTRAEYEELAAVAEFTRRREEQYEASKARGDKPRQRDGEFAAEELGIELNCSHYAAGKRMELADGLSRRLPCTFAGMAAGTIDGYKAKIIFEFTRFLSDEQAAEADQILAAAAPGMAPAELKKKAARLEMRLDPGGVRERKEEAARKHRRVEARQEASGNASLAGRELAVADALEAKNAVWAEAAALRNAGLDASLREARTMVYLDRLRCLDPWERLAPPYDPPGGYDDPGDDVPAASHADQYPAGDPGEDASFPGNSGNVGEHDDEHGNDDPRDHGGDDGGRFPDYGYDKDENDGSEDEDEDDGDDDDGDDGGPGDPLPGRPGGSAGIAPLPALTTITISAGTLLGWSDAPAEVSGFGLLDPDSARDLIAAASQHPRSRWCVTVLGTDGEAIAHGCASGRHSWSPENPRDGTARAGPDDHQRAQLTELLRQLGITPAPIAKGECDHQHREDRYRPSRKLQHLIRARTATCPAPGCNAHATHNEVDHTIPWPAGPTEQGNLSPPCSRHHHAKHGPGWKLEQPEPGVMQWTPPNGRVYTTRPTRYDE